MFPGFGNSVGALGFDLAWYENLQCGASKYHMIIKTMAQNYTEKHSGLVFTYDVCVQVFKMDISKQRQAYEVEYHVLQEEVLDGPSTLRQSQRAAQLEKTNGSLRQQNLDLLEEVQVSLYIATHDSMLT